MSPLVYLTLVVVLGVSAQWLSWLIRIPAILVLLAFGFAAGRYATPDEFFEPDVLFPLISLSVAIILFEGGLSLRFRELRDAGHAVLRLCTIGVLTTWVLSTATLRLLLFEDLGVAALAGAVFVVTGPTVIIPMLRQIRPTRRVGSVARWEGIVIDPIGAVLAVLVYAMAAAGGFREGTVDAVLVLLKTLGISAGLGLAAAALLVFLLRKHWAPDYLQSPLALALVVGTFSISDYLQPESGLATVTLFGVLMANQKLVSIQHLVEFKENLGVLLVSGLFIVLASRVGIDEVTAVGWKGAAVLAALVLVVRPAATVLSTLGTPLSWRETVFLSWLAPRGIVAAAVSSVFAIELSHLGDAHPVMAREAALLPPLTFLVIVGTVSIYGLSAGPLARRLGLADPDPQGILVGGANAVSIAIAKTLHDKGYYTLVVDSDKDCIARARMEGLPTVQAEVHSVYVREEVDLGGIGRMLALTDSDHLNSLAALEFVEEFERANVFQLPPEAQTSPRKEPGSDHLRGRSLFSTEAHYDYLAERIDGGAVVKATRLSEEFDNEAFRDRYGPTALPMFLIEESGNLTVIAAEDEPEPAKGQTLVALVDPPPESDGDGVSA